jgi:hypothetical protein
MNHSSAGARWAPLLRRDGRLEGDDDRERDELGLEEMRGVVCRREREYGRDEGCHSGYRDRHDLKTGCSGIRTWC